MKPTIFLCGPMRGLTRTESLGWRLEATQLLSNNFIVLHAMRNREEKETLPDPKAAIARDKHDILKSDVILVNDTVANASMIGTAMEVLFAFEQHKIIVLFGNAHPQDYWLNYHSHIRAQTLEEACHYINTFFSGVTS